MSDHTTTPVITSQRAAVLLCIIVVLWVLSGQLFSGEPEELTTQPATSAKAQQVRTLASTAVRKTKTITINGVTAPSRQVNIKAEVGGKVTAIPVKEGSPIKEGETILTIETRDREAALAEAEASVAKREIDYKAAKKLSTKGYQAETTLSAAKAELEAARARLIRTRLDVNNGNVTAPFDGWLERVNVEVGTLIGPGIMTGEGTFNDGDTIAVVIDRDPFIITGQVAERHVPSLHPGIRGNAKLASGETVDGTVRYIAAVANPLTRTFTLELEVPARGNLVQALPTYASGMTATIRLPADTAMAHAIPSSVLVLDDNGTLGIKALDNLTPTGDKKYSQGIVTFHPVEIFDTDTNGLWVTGLPDNLAIITLGQAFVQPGDTAITAP